MIDLQNVDVWRTYIPTENIYWLFKLPHICIIKLLCHSWVPVIESLIFSTGIVIRLCWGFFQNPLSFIRSCTWFLPIRIDQGFETANTLKPCEKRLLRMYFVKIRSTPPYTVARIINYNLSLNWPWWFENPEKCQLFEEITISYCVNVRPPESTFLWKAIWYLNFWYFKLYFIFFLQFFQFEIEKWRKFKIWSQYLPSSRQKIFGQWTRNVLIETVNIDRPPLFFVKMKFSRTTMR